MAPARHAQLLAFQAVTELPQEIGSIILQNPAKVNLKNQKVTFRSAGQTKIVPSQRNETHWSWRSHDCSWGGLLRYLEKNCLNDRKKVKRWKKCAFYDWKCGGFLYQRHQEV